MDIKTAVTIINSVESKETSVPFDSWKIIIEYLHDEDYEDGFGLLLQYCAINKFFSKFILEYITKAKFTIDMYECCVLIMHVVEQIVIWQLTHHMQTRIQ
jgi:hypothetical protein